jgi:class 3 adenylate cyclase
VTLGPAQPPPTTGSRGTVRALAGIRGTVTRLMLTLRDGTGFKLLELLFRIIIAESSRRAGNKTVVT